MIKNKMKYCPHCKIWKSISEFYNNKAAKDGLGGYCKKCSTEKTIVWQKQHLLRYRLIRIKGSIKQAGHKWEISDKYAYKLMQSPCVYCGQIQDNYNGLDRIDSSKEYTKDNIVSCCIKCNRAKNDMTVKEFLNHIKKICKSVKS